MNPGNSNCQGKLKLLRVTGVLCYNWVLKKKRTETLDRFQLRAAISRRREELSKLSVHGHTNV